MTQIATGFTDFDKLTGGGLHSSSLTVVAGNPDTGKTAFISKIALNTVSNNTAVATFSNEPKKYQILLRMLCFDAEVDFDKARDDKLNNEEWSKLAKATSKISEAPIYMGTSCLKIDDIREKASYLSANHDIGLVIVDQISKGLKALSKDLDVPVVATFEPPNQKTGKDQSDDLQLSHLPEGIEPESDVVVFLRSQPANKPKGFVTKNCNGPTGKFDLT